ncbi:MAG: hypothetical protein LUE22_00830 [Oscillospiraceae bacterium]|nr:hypothetical protein [Oscillospiraceae bacterium]
MDYKGIGYLRSKLATKRARVLMRYQFYEQKNTAMDFDISTPPSLKYWQSVLGWCGKAVDSLADRLLFREFREDNFDLTGIFQMNNPDIFFDNAVLSALISSCCFVYISPDDIGFPRLQVVDGGNATGVIDEITGLLEEGYAVLERDDKEIPTVEAYFLPRRTEVYRQGEKEPEVYEHNVDYPLLVPVIYRPDAARPFGHSRISRACISLVGSALRTIKRSEISAEFYSYPQKYVTGLSQEAEPIEKWRAAMSAMMTFTRDEDGGVPTVGQFSQQSMSPHVEQLRMFASLFAGETGLTLDDLGFATENPSSAEAIKATHENLRLTAKKAQRDFGSGFLNVGYLAACLRDDFPYKRRQIYLTTPIWEPVFEPDAAMLSSIRRWRHQGQPGCAGLFHGDQFAGPDRHQTGDMRRFTWTA